MYHTSLGNLTTHITITLNLAVDWGRLSSAQWLVGHGIDPQAVDKDKETAKDWAKSENKTEVVDFLDKVQSMGDLFPIEKVSPLHFFAMNGGYTYGLRDYINSEHQTSNSDANQEVITYASFTGSTTRF